MRVERPGTIGVFPMPLRRRPRAIQSAGEPRQYWVCGISRARRIWQGFSMAHASKRTRLRDAYRFIGFRPIEHLHGARSKPGNPRLDLALCVRE